MADTTEIHIALREAYQIAASDSFFAARKELRDTEHERYIFDAGFRRGFDVHESLQRKPTPTPPADAALADDALCESLIEASDMRWNGDVYIGDGADLMNLVRAALRALAMPDVMSGFLEPRGRASSSFRIFVASIAELRHAWILMLRLNDAIGRLLVAADNLSYEPGTVGGIAELQDAADELGRAMLAASKGGE